MTSPDLIESVARAIFNRLDTEGRSHWEDQPLATQIPVRDAARAAIEAVLRALLNPSKVPQESELAFASLEIMVRNFARAHAIDLEEKG